MPSKVFELYDVREGGPYDSGSADAYFGRDFDPHYYVGMPLDSRRIPLRLMSAEDIVAYSAGYRDGSRDRSREKVQEPLVFDENVYHF